MIFDHKYGCSGFDCAVEGCGCLCHAENPDYKAERTDPITERLDEIAATNDYSQALGDRGLFEEIRSLIAALRGVVALHQPHPQRYAKSGVMCKDDKIDYPCNTLRAIASALDVTL